MSGHSKWSQIKRGKQIADLKKGNLFAKLGNAITIAARQGSGLETNFKLRIAIEKAKAINMPKETIERAIKRGTGEIKGAKIEEIIYEAFVPEGVALVIETLTDNKNRTTAELKKILGKYKGNLAGTNSVLWMFERKGIIRISLPLFTEKCPNKEEGMLKLIDLGTEDVKEETGELIVYIKPENLQEVKENLEKEELKVEYAETEWVAKDRIKIKSEKTKADLERLFNELDEMQDVNNYFSNLENFY